MDAEKEAGPRLDIDRLKTAEAYRPGVELGDVAGAQRESRPVLGSLGLRRNREAQHQRDSHPEAGQ
jgi:hypothetical protein